MITENIEVSDKMLASGRLADVSVRTCIGHPVAMKTINKSRRTGWCLEVKKGERQQYILVRFGCGSDHPSPAIVVFWSILPERLGARGHR